MSILAQWWRQPERYRWLVYYLEAHGVQTQVRLLMLPVLISGGLTPLLILGTSAAPQHPFGRALSVAAGSVWLATVLFWVGPTWPSRRRSVIFSVTTTVCVAVSWLSGANPAVALAGCAQFLLVGGYVAMFHTPRLIVFNAVVALGTVTALAVEVGRQEPVLAALGLVTVIVLNSTVVVSTNWLINVLSVDMVNSDLDALTGLLNRRACLARAGELVALHRSDAGSYLLIVLIDLDQFKKLNDTRGHAIGDSALVAIGRALRGQSRQATVVGRVGGEEFLIVDVIAHADVAAEIAERLRESIIMTPPHLSGSVGAVTIPLPLPDIPAVDLIELLSSEADAAMYEAKRAGGNQFRIRLRPSLG